MAKEGLLKRGEGWRALGERAMRNGYQPTHGAKTPKHPPSGGSAGEYPELVQDFPAMDWVKDGSYYQSKRRAFLTGPYAFPVCETTVERLFSYILAIGWPHSWRDKRLVVRVPCGRRVVDAARM